MGAGEWGRVTRGIPPLEFGPNGEMPRIIGVARYLFRRQDERSIPPCEQLLIKTPEQILIQHILSQPDIFPWFFDFMLEAALGSHPRGKDIDILCGIRRADAGLNPAEKPGDFDIVMLPQVNGAYYLHKVMAVEVKVLRLAAKNRDAHVRPSGASQARGMVKDGIPFVGLLHIILPEPSPVEQWRPLVRHRILNENLESEALPGVFPIDMAGADALIRHFGRMRRHVDGTCIGARAIALVSDGTGRKIIGRALPDMEIGPSANHQINKDLLKRFCNIAASCPQPLVVERREDGCLATNCAVQSGLFHRRAYSGVVISAPALRLAASRRAKGGHSLEVQHRCRRLACARR